MNLPVKIIQDVPKSGDAGFFGAIRKYDIHRSNTDVATTPGRMRSRGHRGTLRS